MLRRPRLTRRGPHASLATQRPFKAEKYEVQYFRIDCSSEEGSSYAGEMSGNALPTFTSTNPRITGSALLLTVSTHRLRQKRMISSKRALSNVCYCSGRADIGKDEMIVVPNGNRALW
jgi:hypothetical protein